MTQRNAGIKLVRRVKDGALIQNTRIGPGAAALRRMAVDRLKSHIEAFYEYGTLPDLLLLCAAFDHIEHERLNWSPERAWLVDALLMKCVNA